MTDIAQLLGKDADGFQLKKGGIGCDSKLALGKTQMLIIH